MAGAPRASSHARRSCCAASSPPCNGRYPGRLPSVSSIRRCRPIRTWRRSGRRIRSVRALEPVTLELGQEGEALHRSHAVEVDLAVQVIELVLEDARVKALRRIAEQTPVAAERLDPEARPARHLAAQVGDAEAALPVLLLLVA